VLIYGADSGGELLHFMDWRKRNDDEHELSALCFVDASTFDLALWALWLE